MTSKHTEPERNTKTQEIKSYLTHEISVLGKTVPTLAIAAIIMIGGASAALLDSFGTVQGTTSVDAPIQIDDQSVGTDGQLNIESSFAGSVKAGSFVNSVHTVENTGGETVEVELSSKTDAGAEAYGRHVLVGRTSPEEDEGGYDISTSISEPLVSGSDYSVSLSGTDTADYGVLIYDVDEINSDSTISYNAEIGDSHDAGTEIDEVVLYTEDGQYPITGGEVTSGEVTIDLEDASYPSGEPNNYVDVVSIGIAYGDADAVISNSPDPVNIDVTVDDVEVDDKNVDEASSSTHYLAETGKFTESFELGGDTYEGTGRFNYRLVNVGAFSPYLTPASVQVSSSVNPPTTS